MKHRLLFILLLAVLLPVSVSAQTDPELETTPIDGGVRIDWPTPVTEVFSTGEVIGSAAIEGMLYYYLEYIQLNDDLSIPENAPWIPATVAISAPVVDGPLAMLDTTTVPDGLYALRLVVVTVDQQSYSDLVLPVRVSNERFTAYTERVITAALAAAGLTPDPTPEPPTPEPPSIPMAYPAAGIEAANVRYCDVVDNDRCPIVEFLDGRGGQILGFSATGSGWVLVRLPSGLEGWVAPIVTTLVGDVTTLPFLSPPAPLPPPAAPNVILNGIALRGGGAACGLPFEVEINVANVGTAAANGATVTVQDVNISTGEVTATAYGSFPTLNPGANYVVIVPLVTTAYYNETHELRAALGNENVRVQYVLQQGNCNVQPTPPPPPPPPEETFFNPNQCFIVLTDRWPAFGAPYGELITQLAARAWEARSLRLVNGERWYSINTPELGVLWLTRVNSFLQGGCG